jgi:hypothetical protein
VVPILCFVVMTLYPRERSAEVRSLGWLIVPLMLTLAFGPPKGEHWAMVLTGLVMVAAVLVVLFAIAMLPTDPKWAMAGAIPLTNLGLIVSSKPSVGTITSVLFISAAPMAFSIAVLRFQRLRRETPL